MDFTQIFEILVIVLLAIEIVELYFNMRAIRVHEKELNGHLQKLEQVTMKLDSYINSINQLDEHIKTLDKLVQKTESRKNRSGLF